jgi:hypothetical protein
MIELDLVREADEQRDAQADRLHQRVDRMNGRGRVVVVGVLIASLTIGACGRARAHPAESASTTATTTTFAVADDARLCSMLEMPLNQIGPGHRSFFDVVRNDPSDSEAIGAALTLALSGRPGAAGRFDAVLAFLSTRSEVLLDPKHGPGDVPSPSREVIENARELDAFLANGGCD